MASTVWRGRLAFGMVSIPVRLFKAARRERVRFHNVYRPAARWEPEAEPEEEAEPEPVRAPSKIREFPKAAAPVEEELESPEVERVRNVPVLETSGGQVSRSEVLKGYEIAKDRFVTFQPEEIARVRPQTSTELTIGEFVRLAEIDPIYFDASYYAAADKGGDKPYALLYAALAESGYAAVGTLAMHGREHATVIRPGRQGLILHTLFYQKEVRSEEEYRSDGSLVNAKELELARKFVEALAAPFDPGKLKDSLEERLREMIEARSAGAAERRPAAEAASEKPVPDLMEALRRSLEKVKKPPASQKAEGKPPSQRTKRNKA